MQEVTEITIKQCPQALKIERIKIAIFFLFSLILISTFSSFLENTFGFAFSKQFSLLMYVISILLVIFISMFFKELWSHKTYIVTADKIKIIDGILGQRFRVHGLGGFLQMQIIQSFIEKQYDYGTITIEFMGGRIVNIRNIRQPSKYIDVIHAIITKGKIVMDD